MFRKHPRIIRAFFIEPRVPLGVVVFFVLAAILTTWFSTAEGYRTKTSNLMERYLIGETITAPGITFTIENVRKDPAGAGPLVPRAGYEFIIPTISITNTSDTALTLAPLLHFHIRDAVGNVYLVAAIPSEGAQFSGTILPHDTIREEIGFEVAKDVSGLTLYFEPGISDHSLFAVDLETKTPSWWPWSE